MYNFVTQISPKWRCSKTRTARGPILGPCAAQPVCLGSGALVLTHSIPRSQSHGCNQESLWEQPSTAMTPKHITEMPRIDSTRARVLAALLRSGWSPAGEGCVSHTSCATAWSLLGPKFWQGEPETMDRLWSVPAHPHFSISMGFRPPGFPLGPQSPPTVGTSHLCQLHHPCQKEQWH